jgi:hypothetical protein
VNVKTGGDGGGSVSVDGIDCGADCTKEFADGTTVRLTAAPDVGSDFVRWRGVDCDEGRGDETCTLRVDDDLTAVAVFEQQSSTTWTVNVKTGGDGGGSVSVDGIDCGADCTKEFADGTTVRLTAAPDEFSNFVSWDGVACDGGSQQEALCTFTVEGDAQVVALFGPDAEFTPDAPPIEPFAPLKPEDPFGSGGVE